MDQVANEISFLNLQSGKLILSLLLLFLLLFLLGEGTLHQSGDRVLVLEFAGLAKDFLRHEEGLLQHLQVHLLASSGEAILYICYFVHLLLFVLLESRILLSLGVSSHLHSIGQAIINIVALFELVLSEVVAAILEDQIGNILELRQGGFFDLNRRFFRRWRLFALLDLWCWLFVAFHAS